MKTPTTTSDERVLTTHPELAESILGSAWNSGWKFNSLEFPNDSIKIISAEEILEGIKL